MSLCRVRPLRATNSTLQPNGVWQRKCGRCDLSEVKNVVQGKGLIN